MARGVRRRALGCGWPVEGGMHTTIDIDEDVLAAARTLATRQGKSAGRVVSELLREALRARTGGRAATPSGERYGFRPIPAGGVVVTNELVNRIREDAGV